MKSAWLESIYGWAGAGVAQSICYRLRQLPPSFLLPSSFSLLYSTLLARP